MQKKIAFLLVGLWSSTVFASEVYIDQAGSSTTIDITQTGSSNEVSGDAGTTTAASVDGTGIDLDITQIGDNNVAEINLDTATSADIEYTATGSDNLFDIAVEGDGNEVTICGTNGAANFGAITSSGTTTAGTSCSTGIASNGNTNTVTTYGDYNLVNIEQGAGVGGSTNTVTIGTTLSGGNNNVVNITQDNAEANTVTLTVDGSSNVVNILQDN
jgi:hypothetical protein